MMETVEVFVSDEGKWQKKSAGVCCSALLLAPVSALANGVCGGQTRGLIFVAGRSDAGAKNGSVCLSRCLSVCLSASCRLCLTAVLQLKVDEWPGKPH